MSREEQSHLSGPTVNPHRKKLRIILVGKVGAGKTSAGNIILSGSQPFPKPTSSFGLNTKKCLKKSEIIGDKKVTVVDTPGLCSIGSLSEEDTVKELKESVELVKPGPHVFLLVMRYGKVFTKEEEKTLEILQRTFGKNVMAYTLILFTHSQNVDRTAINIFSNADGNTGLRDTIIQCHFKYMVLNIKGMNDTQVPELLDKISDMVTNSQGGFYSIQMLQEAEKSMGQQQEKENDEPEELKGHLRLLKMSGLIGAAATCAGTYFFGRGEPVPSSIVGGILVMTLVCTVVIARNKIRRCFK